jgi:hypothetical protein
MKKFAEIIFPFLFFQSLIPHADYDYKGKIDGNQIYCYGINNFARILELKTPKGIGTDYIDLLDKKQIDYIITINKDKTNVDRYNDGERILEQAQTEYTNYLDRILKIKKRGHERAKKKK